MQLDMELASDKAMIREVVHRETMQDKLDKEKLARQRE